MNTVRVPTNAERAALRKRTARALQLLWAFKDMPVQVGAPCLNCGCLYWWVTGSEPIAPRGYCLNCNPAEIASRHKLLKLVAASCGDMPPDEDDAVEEDIVPELPDQMHLFE